MRAVLLALLISGPALADTVIETESCRWVKKVRPAVTPKPAAKKTAAAPAPAASSPIAKPKKRRLLSIPDEYEEICDVIRTPVIPPLVPTPEPPPPEPIVPGLEPLEPPVTFAPPMELVPPVYFEQPPEGEGPPPMFFPPRGSCCAVFTPPQIPAPIPEPETWALMLAGLALVGWKARRIGEESDK